MRMLPPPSAPTAMGTTPAPTATPDRALSHHPGSSYRVRVERGGITHEQHDPYAFRHEWMGAMDRHLFAEGNHHHIWQRMGAHPQVQDGVAGVQFCLWAPNARSVSLIGECTNWDGRHLPMQQRLGGIWELFDRLYPFIIRPLGPRCVYYVGGFGSTSKLAPKCSKIPRRGCFGRFLGRNNCISQ